MSISSLAFNAIAKLTDATTSRRLTPYYDWPPNSWLYSYYCGEPSVIQLAARDAGNKQSDLYGLVHLKSLASLINPFSSGAKRERCVKLGTIPTAQAEKIITRFNKFTRGKDDAKEGVKLRMRFYDELPDGSVSWPKSQKEAVVDYDTWMVFGLHNGKVCRTFASLGNVAPEQRMKLFMAALDGRSQEELGRKRSIRFHSLLDRAPYDREALIKERYRNLLSEKVIGSHKVRFPKECA